MQTARPVFLQLWRIRQPMSAIISILHRVSGVLMVFAMPVLASLFYFAVASPEGFEAVSEFLSSWLVRLLFVGMVWSLLHHLVAGIRHLFLDIGVGVTREKARWTAWATMIGGLILLVITFGLGRLLS